MNAKGVTPWLGWLVAGALAAYIAVDKSRVATPVAAPGTPAVVFTTPQPPASEQPLPQPSVDPSIQAALAALSITARETPMEAATTTRRETDRTSPSAPPIAAAPSPSPVAEGRSSMDMQGDQVVAMTPTLEQMAEDARRLGEGQARYAKSCVGTSTVPFRDVYGNQIQGTLSSKDLPECVALKAEMAGLQAGLEKKGVEVQDAARRAGVLPGVIRRLVEKYRLQAYMKP